MRGKCASSFRSGNAVINKRVPLLKDNKSSVEHVTGYITNLEHHIASIVQSYSEFKEKFAGDSDTLADFYKWFNPLTPLSKPSGFHDFYIFFLTGFGYVITSKLLRGIHPSVLITQPLLSLCEAKLLYPVSSNGSRKCLQPVTHRLITLQFSLVINLSKHIEKNRIVIKVVRRYFSK